MQWSTDILYAKGTPLCYFSYSLMFTRLILVNMFKLALQSGGGGMKA